MTPIYLNPQYIFLLYKEHNKKSIWPSEFMNCASSLPIEPNPYKLLTNEKPMSERINMHSKLSFDECMYDSVRKLECTDDPLLVFWSGGMDSTAMISAIDNFGSKDLNDRTFIAATNGSILENPEGFKYLKTKYDFIGANQNLDYLAKDYKIVHGNSSDRLCCSVSAHYIISKYGEELLWKPYTVLFASPGYENFALYADIIQYCPIPIKTAYDFLWWHSITQGAAATLKKIRSIAFADRSFIDDIFHFFDSDNFVSWSVLNQDKIIPNKQWSNYKDHVRQFCKTYFPIPMVTNSQYPSNWYYYYLQTNIACEFTDVCFDHASKVTQDYKDFLLCK